MATILVEDSENLEKAIKRFKRMVEKEPQAARQPSVLLRQKPSAKDGFFVARPSLLPNN